MAQSLRFSPPVAIATLLLLALFAVSIAVYPELPVQIPQHFGADGRVDRWVPTSMASWLLLPIVAAAVTAFVLGISLVAARDIRYVNMPNKERILALPAERQADVLLLIRRTLQWIGAVVALMFCGIQAEVYVSALGRSNALLPLVTVGCILAIVAVVAVMAVRLQSMARSAEPPR